MATQDALRAHIETVLAENWRLSVERDELTARLRTVRAQLRRNTEIEAALRTVCSHFDTRHEDSAVAGSGSSDTTSSCTPVPSSQAPAPPAWNAPLDPEEEARMLANGEDPYATCTQGDVDDEEVWNEAVQAFVTTEDDIPLISPENLVSEEDRARIDKILSTLPSVDDELGDGAAASGGSDSKSVHFERDEDDDTVVIRSNGVMMSDSMVEAEHQREMRRPSAVDREAEQTARKRPAVVSM